MKRYCLRPDIKDSITSIAIICIAVVIVLNIVLALLYAVSSATSLTEQPTAFVIAVIVGRLFIGIGIGMVIVHIIKNYKSWFVECKK